jgi:hypothetical protein
MKKYFILQVYIIIGIVITISTQSLKKHYKALDKNIDKKMENAYLLTTRPKYDNTNTQKKLIKNIIYYLIDLC